MMRFTASQFISTCLAAGFACGLAPAWAASATDSLYQQERQRCLDGSTQQDQRTCLQEAKAARDQMRRGLLQTEATATLAANAVLRCQVHKVDADRQACVRMARGEGEVSGSVAAGGVIRADTTVTVGSVPAAPPPASSPR